jgi:hypothetical protein
MTASTTDTTERDTLGRDHQHDTQQARQPGTPPWIITVRIVTPSRDAGCCHVMRTDHAQVILGSGMECVQQLSQGLRDTETKRNLSLWLGLLQELCSWSARSAIFPCSENRSTNANQRRWPANRRLRFLHEASKHLGRPRSPQNDANKNRKWASFSPHFQTSAGPQGSPAWCHEVWYYNISQ